MLATRDRDMASRREKAVEMGVAINQHTYIAFAEAAQGACHHRSVSGTVTPDAQSSRVEISNQRSKVIEVPSQFGGKLL